jgi:hypothetical protein
MLTLNFFSKDSLSASKMPEFGKTKKAYDLMGM